jgi:hypothetical protein
MMNSPAQQIALAETVSGWRWRFSIARLFVNTAIVAGFLPFLPLFSVHLPAIGLAALLLMSFAVWELREPDGRLAAAPRYIQISFGVSRVAFVYAIALGFSLVAWILQGPPPPSGTPPTGFFATLLYIFSGQFLAGLGPALEYEFRLIIHWELILLLSSLSCIAAFIASGRYPPAKWLCFLRRLY